MLCWLILCAFTIHTNRGMGLVMRIDHMKRPFIYVYGAPGTLLGAALF